MTDKRHRVLSVTLDDCEVQTFRSGGKGGQNQNKRDTGVRIIHHPSGARGESREERSQLQNKKKAFLRMSQHPKFRIWLNHVLYQTPSPEQIVKGDMRPENLMVEVLEGGVWRRVILVD